MILKLIELPFTVIPVSLNSCSAHGNKGKESIPEHILNTYQYTLPGDVKQSRKEGHQYARYEEGICQDLHIDRRTVGEKSLCPDYKESNQDLYPKTYSIIP